MFNIRNIIRKHKAESLGIDPKTYNEYKKEKDQAMYRKTLQVERETEEKLIQARGDAKINAYKKRVKQGSPIKRAMGEMKKYKKSKAKKRSGTYSSGRGMFGGSNPEFGLSNNNKNGGPKFDL